MVFRDQSGKYAVLEPQNMTRAKMRCLLTEQLGIIDRRTLDALTDKADRVTDYYARQDTALLSADRAFKMEDFEPEKIIEHKYTGASGMEYTTKQKPLDSVENSIQRTGKDSFTVNTVFRSTEITDMGDSIPHEQTEHLDFTLSDKKRTLHFLSAMYMDAGMSEADAKSMAKEVYSKTEAQSPKTVLRIEEVRQDSMTVAYGKASVVLSTADRQEASEKIAGLGVSPQTAETMVEKALEIRVDAIKECVTAVQAQQTDFNTAMNHLTDREERAIDTMIVSSAAEPEKHIVVEGGHNGSRVVHDYAVRDGDKQLAAFTDAETTDANGKIIPGTRDETNLNFYAITEKMRGLLYPPQGSQKPDGLFLTKNLGESDEEFEARRAKAFLCPLDRDFLELERRKPNTLAFRLYKEIRNAPEETGQSFVSSANVKTFFFNLENLKNLTCCDNVDLETLGDKKTAPFIIISATNSTYNFLVSMMYSQLFDTLANRANFKYHGTLPVHVRCMMDEFASSVTRSALKRCGA